MKKHELIKHAYDNYQKGTKFTPPYMSTEYISTGIFNVLSDGDVEMIHPETGKATVLVMCGQEWAEIIPENPSILDVKVAIQVNNEREFKLLMEHYEGKGWKWVEGQEPFEYNSLFKFQYSLAYKDQFHVDQVSPVIPFSDFAKEVGIEVPKFIMKSEDGVDMYEGDNVHWSINDAHDAGSQEWRYLYGTNINEGHINLSGKGFKVFSTKEAAKAWIKEQNKPASICLFGDGDDAEVVVRTDGSISVDKIKIHQGHIGITFPKENVEQIIAAYKSLTKERKEVENG